MTHASQPRVPCGPGDPAIPLITLALVGIGLVMTFSSSYAVLTGGDGTGDTYGLLLRQLSAGIGGCGLLLLLWRLGPRAHFNAAPILLAVSVALLVLVFVPGIGVSANGARRWVRILGYQFQPSEVAKVALVLWMARVGSVQRRGARDYQSFLLLCLIPLVLVLGLIVAEPNLSTALLVMLTSLAVMFLAGLRFRDLALIGVLGVAVLAWVVLRTDYMLDRFERKPFPVAVPIEARNYQTQNCLMAFGNGGLRGTGLAGSIEKFGHVPFGYNDAIFAIVGEELGFVGAVGVILLYGWLLHCGCRVARTSPDAFSALTAGGLTIGLAGQALANMLVVTDLIPATGVNLPFISCGGSSLTMTLAAVGLLLSASRTAGLRPRGGEAVAHLDDRRGYRRAPVPPPGGGRGPLTPPRASSAGVDVRWGPPRR